MKGFAEKRSPVGGEKRYGFCERREGVVVGWGLMSKHVSEEEEGGGGLCKAQVCTDQGVVEEGVSPFSSAVEVCSSGKVAVDLLYLSGVAEKTLQKYKQTLWGSLHTSV